MNEFSNRRGCLKPFLFLLFGFVCLILIWLVFNLRSGPAAGRPVVEVGSETTIISEPLDENGDPDFLAAINQQNSEGVTPENNAVVKLAQAAGVPGQLKEELAWAFFDALGVDTPASDEPGFVAFDSWSFEEEQLLQGEVNVKTDGKSKSTAADEPAVVRFDYVKTSPWSANDFPLVGRWIDQSEPSMKIAREGIARKEYFYPLVTTGKPRMLTASLAWLDSFRAISDFLSVNAMRHLNDGDVDRCLKEIYAIHRLASHIATGSTLVEQLVATAIANRSC